MFWLRGLVPSSWAATPAPPFDEARHHCGYVSSIPSYATTMWATDGSGGHWGRDPRLRRRGWGAAAFGKLEDPMDEPSFCLCGPLPGFELGPRVRRPDGATGGTVGRHQRARGVA